MGNKAQEAPRNRACAPGTAKRKIDAATRNFIRGYFCAVAVLLQDEGASNARVDTLWNGGGGVESAKYADPEDINVFRHYGFLTNEGRT
jgi:hypothetical protein